MLRGPAPFGAGPFPVPCAAYQIPQILKCISVVKELLNARKDIYKELIPLLFAGLTLADISEHTLSIAGAVSGSFMVKKICLAPVTAVSGLSELALMSI